MSGPKYDFSKPLMSFFDLICKVLQHCFGVSTKKSLLQNPDHQIRILKCGFHTDRQESQVVGGGRGLEL